MKYSLGIDIGGTNLKVGLVGRNRKIFMENRVKTDAAKGYEHVRDSIIKACNELLEQAKITSSDLKQIGIGCPGTCNQQTGFVEYSNNLGWNNVPLRNDVEAAFGVKTYLDNDANAAAYGEYIAGAAKGCDSAVIITLGTGLGAGIIINGKIFSGSNYAGAEIGHTVIVADGKPCTCGRNGCFEAYSSATGLVNMTKEKLEQHPDSIMAQIAKKDGKISGRTAFKAEREGCSVGTEVVREYIKYLACGLINVINVFQPDILCIGGGVCNEGEYLLNPLKELIAREIYSKNSAKNTKITICELGNTAGIIGAAMLGSRRRRV